MNVIDVFCFLFLASFVRFAHLLILHTSTSSTYLPSTIFPSIFFLNPSSGSPFFPLLSISPLLRASRWQTDSWMSDGQNKETQMWTIILALTHACRTRPSPGLWGQGLCWWSCGIAPWIWSHLRGGNKMAVCWEPVWLPSSETWSVIGSGM